MYAPKGLDWVWNVSDDRQLLKTLSGRELIHQLWRRAEPDRIDIAGTGVRDTVDALYERKLAHYEALVRSGEVRLRDGVLDLLLEARVAHVGVTIITGASPASLAYLLHTAMGPDWHFTVRIVNIRANARYVQQDPRDYSEVLAQLKLPGHHCLVIEDSEPGMRAAGVTGIPVLVTALTDQHRNLSGAMRVVRSLKGMSFATLQSWMVQSQSSAHLAQEARAADAVSLGPQLLAQDPPGP